METMSTPEMIFCYTILTVVVVAPIKDINLTVCTTTTSTMEITTKATTITVGVCLLLGITVRVCLVLGVI